MKPFVQVSMDRPCISSVRESQSCQQPLPHQAEAKAMPQGGQSCHDRARWSCCWVSGKGWGQAPCGGDAWAV